MILLSNKKMQINSVISLESIKNDFNFNLLNNNEFNAKVFFHKILVNLDWTDNLNNCDLIDDLFTTCYKVDFHNDKVKILEKVDLNDYILEIFICLLENNFELNSHISTYIYEYLALNPEILLFVRDNPDLILSLLKKSFNNSIYSITSVCLLLDNFNIFNNDYLNEIGILIGKCINTNDFYSENILIDLINIGKKTNAYDICVLEELLAYKIGEDNCELPFPIN